MSNGAVAGAAAAAAAGQQAPAWPAEVTVSHSLRAFNVPAAWAGARRCRKFLRSTPR